jgi:hypothetical protein
MFISRFMPASMGSRYTLTAALLAALALPVQADPPEGPRVLRAAPLTSAIQVDGRLDEAAWAAAEVATDFRQLEPEEGAPASQRTEVRVLYGPLALYIGAVIYDTPEAVRRPLTRRDEAGDGDAFYVSIDGYGTGRTAFVFGVTAAGVQIDAVRDAVYGQDPSWDAVWDAAVRHTLEGWTVEMAIPYAMLRFNRADEQTWWVQFQRTISRNNEQAYWEPVAREDLGVGFIGGRLTGLRGIAPRANVQVRPYTLSRLTREPEAGLGPGYAQDTGFDAGVDVKLGLGANTFLDLTVNPDFGQVEADPAVLNLTTFETFFPERRPFFLEGTSIFDYLFAPGDGPILHTRRIGGFGRIVGAGKLTGRTPGGLAYGFVGAATSDGFAQGEGGPVYTGEDFSPDLLYGAGRVKHEFGDRSFVGGAVTYFDGFGGDYAFDHVRSVVAGTDFDVRLRQRTYRWDGALTGSYRAFGDAFDRSPQTGFALYTGLDRVRGVVTWGTGLRVYSNAFEPNEVGFFRENDVIRLRGAVMALANRGQPFGPFRLARGTLSGQQSWTFRDPVNTGLFIQSRADGFLRSFHRVSLLANVNAPGGVDVRESRGMGPVALVPGVGGAVEYVTDSRRRFTLSPRLSGALSEDGSTAYSAILGSTWTASDRLALAGSVRFEARDGVRAWVANESFRRNPDGFALGNTPNTGPGGQSGFVPLPGNLDAVFQGLPSTPGAGGTTDYYYAAIFGARDQQSLDTSLRATLALRPNLSFQAFSQLFAARFRYDGFRVLAGPSDLRDLGEAYPRRRDQTSHSLILNAVARWEYRPGSTVYVVWAHNRNGAAGGYAMYDPLLPSPYDRGTLGLAADTFDLLPTNVFLIKLNYLLLR